MRKDTTQTGSNKLGYTYERIEDDIRLKVRDGVLSPGSMLPSRAKLAAEYGVALTTIQHAVSRLVSEGVLVARDKRGTYVADDALVLASRSETNTANIVIPSVPVRETPIRIGILSTSRLYHSDPGDIGGLWTSAVMQVVERLAAVEGAVTESFDRFPVRLGPTKDRQSDDTTISMREAMETLISHGVDCFIVVGLCDIDDDAPEEIVTALDLSTVPIVYLSWRDTGPPLTQIYYDNQSAGYTAADHLLKAGYRSILFLTPFQGQWIEDRIGAARKAVRHAGIPPESFVVRSSTKTVVDYDLNQTADYMYELARYAFNEPALLGGETGPTGTPWGIIAPNDYTAFQVIQAARDAGRVPGVDFGLVGFDDDPLSCVIGLTTVRPPVEAMAEAAVKMLLDSLRGGWACNGQRSQMRSIIIPRASTDRRIST